MSSVTLLPYNEPRNLDQDAWYLYETTSIPYYETCARLCREFADLYNRLLTGHGLHGAARLDYWVSSYVRHAENIERGIGLIKLHGDYMPMQGFLNSPASDYRGLVEQPLGWMTEEQRKAWNQSFTRLSSACCSGSETLQNNGGPGLNWLERAAMSEDERRLWDRDDSHVGSNAKMIRILANDGVFVEPTAYPAYRVDRNVKGRPGGRCPRSGVWVPEQWVDGAGDFSLAFCIEGRPMQPAYHIIGLEPSEQWPDITYKETRCVDTTWYYVQPPAAAETQPLPLRLRCEAGEPCPRAGYWLTPAQLGSRRMFIHGALMPQVDGDYGATLWQWDQQQ